MYSYHSGKHDQRNTACTSNSSQHRHILSGLKGKGGLQLFVNLWCVNNDPWSSIYSNMNKQRWLEYMKDFFSNLPLDSDNQWHSISTDSLYNTCSTKRTKSSNYLHNISRQSSFCSCSRGRCIHLQCSYFNLGKGVQQLNSDKCSILEQSMIFQHC